MGDQSREKILQCFAVYLKELCRLIVGHEPLIEKCHFTLAYNYLDTIVSDNISVKSCAISEHIFCNE